MLKKELDNLSKKELRTAELGNETNAGQSKEEHAKAPEKEGPKETSKEVVASKEREASKSVNSADTTHSSGVEAGGNKANASQQASADGDSHKEKIRKKLSKKSSNAGSKEKPVRSEQDTQLISDDCVRQTLAFADGRFPYRARAIDLPRRSQMA
ncbi:hypothetical protein ANCDUO_09286 [Ancylostoma duodenale]|uniref:Uncharacterized protein n=1 Tax=Ancylostoma duodenale TaxID=51022 RepID=A0A0C2DDE7_9BILA|nr:hypothetical protein ANCDUO_09286 [Ancylostoma duodenale]